MKRESLVNNVGVDVSDCDGLEEQLTKAGLNWEIQLSPIAYGSDFQYTNGHRQAAYRSDTGALMDVYGPRRKPFKNADIVEHFNSFCDLADLKINRLGCLQAGRKLVAVAPLLWEMDVQQVDDVTNAYLVLRECHESGKGLQITPYTERLVCLNGMTVRSKGLSISHRTVGNESKIAQTLKTAMSALNLYQQQAETLARTPLDDAEAQLQLIAAFGKAGKPLSEQPKPVQTVWQLYKGQGLGSDKLSAFDTAYGLLESVKDFYGWHNFRASNSSLENKFSAVAFGNRNQSIQKFKQQLVSVYARS